MKHLKYIALMMSLHAFYMDAAETSATLDRVEETSATTLRLTDDIFTANPAAMAYFRNYSLSGFGIEGNLSRNDEAEMVQLGTDITRGSVTAQSYMRLNKSAIVWGAAEFTTSNRENVVWNNAADFLLVSPYVIGDSVGGDLTSRKYSFMGGYAGVSNGWSWGAEAAYTASIDYRDRDPRDKIIVSDLLLKAGGSHSVDKNRIIGLGAAMRIYNQESDIEFYNPNNDIHLYPLTGLGYNNPRFSSISDINTAYTGLGYGVTAALLPTDRMGFSIGASFNYLRIRQILRDFNNLELTRSDTYRLNLLAAYMLKAGATETGIVLNAHASRRLGFENLFGSSVGNNYIMIATRRNYYSDNLAGSLTIPVTVKLPQNVTLDMQPTFSARYSIENYRSPRRELAALSLTPELTAGAKWRKNSRWLFSATAKAGHSFSSSCSENLAGLSPTSSLGQAIRHNFSMLTASHTFAGAKLGYDWAVTPSIILAIGVEYCHTAYCDRLGKASEASVNISLKF